MFETLTDQEKRVLARHLRSAGRRTGLEADLLALAPGSAANAYDLPRDGYHGFYSAAIEFSSLSVEVWRG